MSRSFFLCLVAFVAVGSPLTHAMGSLTKGNFSGSEVFPGTTRTYHLWLPEKADSQEPLALMVFLDGSTYLRDPKAPHYAPAQLAKLIAEGAMPPTAGLFIDPGTIAKPGAERPRRNRSYEYDRLGPDFATFLVDELIPSLEVDFSPDPNLRGITGVSSGGIAAFTVAWERPDQFRRVYTSIGSFTGMRGGDRYSTWIRLTEPKPLRLFLHEGKNDLNITNGDWWLANQMIQRSLAFAGYEHEFVWDETAHERKGGNVIQEQALRYLWQDWKSKPVTTNWAGTQHAMAKFFPADSAWEVVSDGHNWSEGMAMTKDGTLYFTDVPDAELFRITPDGKETLVAEKTRKANGIDLSADETRLFTASSGQVRAYHLPKVGEDFSGEFDVVSEGTGANDVAVSRSQKHLYYTDPGNKTVWHVQLETGARKGYPFKDPNGISISPDGHTLAVSHFPSHQIHTYSIDPETGALSNRQPYYHAQLPPNALRGANDGHDWTEKGHLLVGTERGLQILDQEGRCQLILPRPRPEDGRVNYVELAPPYLYIATRHTIYRRKTLMR